MSMEPVEILKELARQYHHFKQENKQKGPVSSRNRQHQQVLRRLEREFERAVDRWVDDDNLHDAWLAHFYHFTPTPRGPTLPKPPIFKGRDSSGQSAALVPAEGGGYQLEVEGKPVGKVPAAIHLPDQHLSKLLVAGLELKETFEIPNEALDALNEYTVNPDRGAPWEYVTDLYKDGVVDPNFGLTRRGRRLMDARRGDSTGVELTLH